MKKFDSELHELQLSPKTPAELCLPVSEHIRRQYPFVIPSLLARPTSDPVCSDPKERCDPLLWWLDNGPFLVSETELAALARPKAMHLLFGPSGSGMFSHYSKAVAHVFVLFWSLLLPCWFVQARRVVHSNLC